MKESSDFFSEDIDWETCDYSNLLHSLQSKLDCAELASIDALHSLMTDTAASLIPHLNRCAGEAVGLHKTFAGYGERLRGVASDMGQLESVHRAAKLQAMNQSKLLEVLQRVIEDVNVDQSILDELENLEQPILFAGREKAIKQAFDVIDKAEIRAVNLPDCLSGLKAVQERLAHYKHLKTRFAQEFGKILTEIIRDKKEDALHKIASSKRSATLRMLGGQFLFALMTGGARDLIETCLAKGPLLGDVLGKWRTAFGAVLTAETFKKAQWLLGDLLTTRKPAEKNQFLFSSSTSPTLIANIQTLVSSKKLGKRDFSGLSLATPLPLEVNGPLPAPQYDVNLENLGFCTCYYC